MIIHYMSASRIKKYLQCPEAYHQAYEQGVRGDAVHLTFGTLVHKVFERWFQEDIDISEIYEQEWNKAGIVSPEFFRDGYDIIEKFTRMNNKHLSTPLGFEFPFAIDIQDDIVVDTSGVNWEDGQEVKAFLKKLQEDDKPYIFGYIDRIDYNMEDDILRIIDYKTSRIPLTQSEADVDEQLSMYALVARYIFPEYARVRLELHYVRHGVIVESYRADSDLDVFKKWLISIFYKIKNDTTHEATLNRYCGWCDAKDNCRAYRELIENGADPEFDSNLDFDQLDSELEKLAVHIKILDSRKKEIEAKFKEHLINTDNAPIQLGGAERFTTSSVRTAYSPSVVARLFPGDLDRLFTANKTEVDKLVKDNPELIDELENTSKKSFTAPILRKKAEKKKK